MILATCRTTMPGLSFHSPAAPYSSLCFERDASVTEWIAILMGTLHEKRFSMWFFINETMVNSSASNLYEGQMSQEFLFLTYWKGGLLRRTGGSAAMIACSPSMGMTWSTELLSWPPRSFRYTWDMHSWCLAFITIYQYFVFISQ